MNLVVDIDVHDLVQPNESDQPEFDPNSWPWGLTRLDPNLDPEGPDPSGWIQIGLIKYILDLNRNLSGKLDLFWGQPDLILPGFLPWGP
jgi:hypothetical protein